MILREATKDDLPAAVELCKATWTAIGLPHDLTADHLAKRLTHLRLVVLYEGKKLLAVLGATPGNYEGHPAYSVGLLAVDQTRKDRLDLLDAIALYSLNIAQSEGRNAVVSQRDKRATNAPYGADQLGMDIHSDTSTGYHQRGNARRMAERILDRHPQWQSL